MKITDLLPGLSAPTFSFELMPLKGQTPDQAIQKFEQLIHLKPLFVDIPYHQQRATPEFLTEKNTVSDQKRPPTEALSKLLISAYGQTPLAHLICRNFTPQQTEKALLQLWAQGVKDVLLLRGDANNLMELNGFPGHTFSYQLVNQVSNLNKGINWQGKASDLKTDFAIGVAGYPEKHAETETFGAGIQHLKQKQEAGAGFIVTQLFYYNSKFFNFKNACRDAGISIPIIPAIAPLTSYKKLEQLPGFFKVGLPEELEEIISGCRNNAEIYGSGINWAVKQTKDLLEAGEKLVHYFAFSEPDATEAVVQKIFK